MAVGTWAGSPIRLKPYCKRVVLRWFIGSCRSAGTAEGQVIHAVGESQDLRGNRPNIAHATSQALIQPMLSGTANDAGSGGQHRKGAAPAAHRHEGCFSTRSSSL